jgi:N-hydroxyarylamine O-acetyltransferase
MSLRLHRYLRRIGYSGPLSPTRGTLHNLHRAHLLAIPFENIDAQLGMVPSLDHDRIFEKLVMQARGGWCFEMNLLFAWALRQVGMRVDVIGATVNRSKAVEGASINHVALLVHLDEPYFADVGFGNGFLNPVPLREGTFNDGRFDFRLTCHGNYWRFYNHRENGATYDFTGEPAAPDTIEMANRSLATTSESPFVQTLVCSRLTEDGTIALTNAGLRIYSPAQITEESAPSHDAFTRILREHFAIDIDRSEALWTRVADQHKTWLRRKIRGF